MKRNLSVLDHTTLDGTRTLVRVDFNCPVANGVVTDATRIREALPTIRYLKDRGARVVLLSHFGRPKGKVDPAYSLALVHHELERLLGSPVTFIHDPADPSAVQTTKRLPRGAVALVENTRFFSGEERNDSQTAEMFAALGDVFVFDAFGAAHRAHATTDAVARILKPAVSGLLVERELQFLARLMDDPARPFIAVLGGAKISGKIDLIGALLRQVDAILIGGAMACTFFRAMGLEVGESLVEPDRLEVARGLLASAEQKLILPAGAVIARALDANAERREVERDAIPAGWAMYDISTNTVDDFRARIHQAKTVVWNGPMGVFETPPFDRGTLGVAHAMADATAGGVVTVVGGGDSAAALAAAGLSERVSHVSTGGGAFLEFLEGKELPGIAALDEA